MKASVTAVLFDLDSTLRDSTQRQHLLPRNNPDSSWDDYSIAGQHDAPIHGPIMAMRLHWPEHQIHIITGSNEIARAETEHWLAMHAPWYDYLALRPAGDRTENSQRKIEYIKSLEAQGTTVLLMYEDYGAAARRIERKTHVPVVVVNALYPCPDCGRDPAAMPDRDNKTSASTIKGELTAGTPRIHHVPGKEGFHDVSQCSPGYCGAGPAV